ncbi:MAG: proline dehydrogenase family protein [Methanoregulaceae archaeon]
MDNRWTLRDLNEVVQWCSLRNTQGIRCTIATLTEYAKTPDQALQSFELNIDCIKTIAEHSLNSSLSVKPTSIGILFDRNEYFRNLNLLFHEAQDHHVGFEIDMEGRNFVADTLYSALELAKEKQPVTVALQAYLDRTFQDIDLCKMNGISVRLVKGSYFGDRNDFATIKSKMQQYVEKLLSKQTLFSIGTHDPELIEWLKNQITKQKNLVEFGFLKGLADRTKIEMVSQGYQIAEYVPFGPKGDAYILRRERYLETLKQLNRSPVP